MATEIVPNTILWDGMLQEADKGMINTLAPIANLAKPPCSCCTMSVNLARSIITSSRNYLYFHLHPHHYS